MTKVKMNSGLACAMLVASIFAGWEALLLVTLLMFIFVEVDEKIQNVAIRVITFYVGYTIVSMGWNLISLGVDFVVDAIKNVVDIINTYVDPVDYVNVNKIIVPVTSIFAIVDSGVSVLLLLARLGFVVSVFTFKPSKVTPLSTKINEYVNKVLNYINGNINVQPAQPAAPVQPTQQQ